MSKKQPPYALEHRNTRAAVRGVRAVLPCRQYEHPGRTTSHVSDGDNLAQITDCGTKGFATRLGTDIVAPTSTEVAHSVGSPAEYNSLIRHGVAPCAWRIGGTARSTSAWDTSG